MYEERIEAVMRNLERQAFRRCSCAIRDPSST